MAGGDEPLEEAAVVRGAPAVRAIDMKSLPSVRLRTFGGDASAHRKWRREAEDAQLLHAIPPERMATLLFLTLEPGNFEICWFIWS
eukprot:5765709-Amphidinium_carterae.2